MKACAWSPAGNVLLSASEDCTLRAWDATSGATVLTMTGHTDDVRACAWGADGGTFLSAGGDGTVRMWDSTSGALLRSFQTGAKHPDPLCCCAYSEDGKAVIGGGFGADLTVWEASTGTVMGTLPGHSSAVRTCVIAKGGQLVTCSNDRTARVWGSLPTAETHRDVAIRACAVNSTGTRVATSPGRAGSSASGVEVWDIASGETLAVFDTGPGTHFCCFCDDEGSAIVTCSGFSPETSQVGDSTFKLWEVKTGRCGQAFSGHEGGVTSVAFTRGFGTAVSGSYDMNVKIWEMGTGECLDTLVGHSNFVTSVSVSADDASILSASADGTLRLWDFSRRRCLHVLQGHAQTVLSCSFSPDGRYVASGSRDTSVRVWERCSGRLVDMEVAQAHTGAVHSCNWDGPLLVSSSVDGTTRWWKRDSEDISFAPAATFYAEAGSTRALCTWSRTAVVAGLLTTESQHVFLFGQGGLVVVKAAIDKIVSS